MAEQPVRTRNAGESPIMNEQEKVDILLIDDDPAIRGVLVEALQRRGYSLRWASEGRTALELLSTIAFRLVVTDIFMPNIDGLELIMKSAINNPGTPVLAISGGGMYLGPHDMLKSARYLGGCRTLAKPFDLSEFFETVVSMLGDES